MSTTELALLDEKEAAARLCLSVSTLRNWRAQHEGPKYVKLGRRSIRYQQSDLTAFVEQGQAVSS